MKFSCCHNSTECPCLLGMAVLRILGDAFFVVVLTADKNSACVWVGVYV